MIRSRPFFNPASGEWIEFTALSEDTDGELACFNWRSVPGGILTEHVNPHQEERFIVTSGEAHVTLDGEERVARQGETIIVPAGMRPSEGNRDRARSMLWSHSGRHCTASSGTRPWPGLLPTARLRPGERRTPVIAAEARQPGVRPRLMIAGRLGGLRRGRPG